MRQPSSVGAIHAEAHPTAATSAAGASATLSTLSTALTYTSYEGNSWRVEFAKSGALRGCKWHAQRPWPVSATASLLYTTTV